MIRQTLAFGLAALATVGVAAQADAQSRSGQSRNEIARAQGVPPGQLPPSNLCRVWYEDRAPGRQPRAVDCRTAEAVASRDRDARVIYGENAYDVRWGNDPDDRYGNNRRDPNRDRAERVGGFNERTAAYQQGYRDGLDKGREDGNRHNSYDVNRHGWYRSGTRGYDNDEGARSVYQDRYRDGFSDGYAEGYRVYSRR